MSGDGVGLTEGMRRANITRTELWHRASALGDVGTPDDLRAGLDGDRPFDDLTYNVIAQALNDVFVERGLDHPVAYRETAAPTDAGDPGGGSP